MKLLPLVILIVPFPFLVSCSSSPADAAVDAATSNMGPAQSAAVRRTTGYGTGPVEKTREKADKQVDRITN